LNLVGINIVKIETRYGINSLARHMIGHVSKIDNETYLKVQKLKEFTYKKESYIGVKGVESLYEKYLRLPQAEYYLSATKDAKGNLLSGLGFSRIENKEIQKNKHDVYLTLDKKIQEIVEREMDLKIKKGAIVIMDVTNGQVVAMASRPNYNQNDLDPSLDEKQDSIFLNRCLQYYYPGSIFKVILSAAALENKMVTPQTTFYCNGAYQFPNGLKIGCWKEQGHGKITLQQALADSCNPTFINLGLMLGRERVLEYIHKFHLDENQLLGYKESTNPNINIDRYSLPSLGNVSIGQQGIMLTPLQIASIMSIVANGGIYREPTILKEVVDSAGVAVLETPKQNPERIISIETAKTIQEMLTSATLAGTSKAAWVEKAGSAGKTSSAQTGIYKKDGKEILNVWFAGYAPLEKPQYAVAILVENGTRGGLDAAPVFKNIMEQILK
jgi:penicillin-binding protein 2